jgi:hypothetical protein
VIDILRMGILAREGPVLRLKLRLKLIIHSGSDRFRVSMKHPSFIAKKEKGNRSFFVMASRVRRSTGLIKLIIFGRITVVFGLITEAMGKLRCLQIVRTCRLKLVPAIFKRSSTFWILKTPLF